MIYVCTEQREKCDLFKMDFFFVTLLQLSTVRARVPNLRIRSAISMMHEQYRFFWLNICINIKWCFICRHDRFVFITGWHFFPSGVPVVYLINPFRNKSKNKIYFLEFTQYSTSISFHHLNKLNCKQINNFDKENKYWIKQDFATACVSFYPLVFSNVFPLFYLRLPFLLYLKSYYFFK